ncbi:cell wall hydrolase [Parablautia muri]|uniref:Cell wall hydrolase n=1 Tax=Parablautia muri TaxID=2320879 RepID=A0A9X5BHH3_9FIRM|nr:cell wall hydrolase [Parablautia muri]NBJ93707.1 cell wall hydrolase [Parablautia muri]
MEKTKVRKTGKKRIAAIMAAVFLVCAFPLTVYADKISDLEKEINERKEEKEQTESEIKSKKNELEDLNEAADRLKGQLNNLNSELTAVSNNLAELEEKIASKNAEIETTEKELEEAWEKEGVQYEAMKKRIQFMYEKRDYIMMEMLFGSASFAELLNRQDYIEKLSEYDRKQLDAFIAIREEIQTKEAQLMQEKEELDELKVSVEAEQSRFEGLVGQVSGEINSTQQEMSEAEAEMLRYEKELEEQKSDIARLQEELAEERRLSQLAAQSAWRDISEISFAGGDRYLLANLIYCEAGNQPYEGQVAVGAVVMNRVMSSVFPDTVVGVIYQNKQFSPVASGRLALALAENRATDACYRAADAAMTGATTVGNCLFFRTPIEGLTGTRIGGHIFY